MLEPITQLRDERLNLPSAHRVPAAPLAPSLCEPTPEDPIRQAMTYLDSAGTTLHPGQTEEADRVLSLLRLATAHLELALERRSGLQLDGSFHGAE